MHHTITEHELPGGAKLLSIHIPNATTYYWASTLRAGYRFVQPQLYELPHLAEHLAFEGTKAYPDALAFKAEVERDGTYYNASTSYDLVSYLYSGVREGFERILPLALGQIYEPLYAEAQVAQEQAVITQEMQRKQEEDSWRLGYLEMHALLPERNLDIVERIKAIGQSGRADLQTYHRTNYGTANTRFVLAGDYTPATVNLFVKNLTVLLKDRPAGRLQPLQPSQFVPGSGRVLTFKPVRNQQALFSLRFTLPGRDQPHEAALRIVATMLTGGLSARLLRKAREAGLTYSIQATAGTNHDITTFSVHSQVTGTAKLLALVRLASEELAAIGAGEFSDAELERATGYYSGSLQRSYQTPAHYASWYLGEFALGAPLESPEGLIERVRAVDRGAIMAAYRRYMTDGNALLTLIGAGLEKDKIVYKELIHKQFATIAV